MRFTLTKRDRKVVNAVARDLGRVSPTKYVHVRKGVIEATDGYVAVQRHIHFTDDIKIMLDAPSLELQGVGPDEVVSYTKEPGNDTVLCKGETTYVAPGLGGTYPSLDRYYPSQEPICQIVVNIDLLKRVIECLDEDSLLKIELYGQKSPMVITANKGGKNYARGMLMPMSMITEQDVQAISWDTSKI